MKEAWQSEYLFLLSVPCLSISCFQKGPKKLQKKMIKRNRAIDCCIQTPTPFFNCASLHATETGVSSGLVSHLAHMQTLPFTRATETQV